MDLSGRFSIFASFGKTLLPQNAPPGETSGEKHVELMHRTGSEAAIPM